MNEKIIFEILKYVAVFFVSIFLPKKITYIIQSFVSYYFKNCLRNWFYFAIEFLSFTLLYFYKNKFRFEDYIDYKSLIVITVLLSVIINLFVISKFLFKKSNVFLSIYPTFTIKENEFIINDIQSEKINEIITEKLKHLNAKFFVFRNGIVHAKIIDIPQFFPIMLGFTNYRNFINKKISKENPISLYLQKDLLGSELRTYLFFDDGQFINAAGFKEINDYALQISLSKERNLDDKIETILFLYIFVCSQSFLDLTLDIKEYDDTLKILYDLEEQLGILTRELELFKIKDGEIKIFYNHWKGTVLRYYSIVYLEKKENIKAVDFILNSDNINPYFPYSTYEKNKQLYINRYLLELLNKAEIFKEHLEVEEDVTEKNNRIANLINKLELESTKPNFDILIEIINRNIDDHELLSYIEQELERRLINCDNVFNLIFIAESFKYLPLGEEMENKIYVNRIPKVVEILEKAVEIDNEFELLYLRIGSLKFIYGRNTSEYELEEAFKYIKKHSYLYTKYGL